MSYGVDVLASTAPPTSGPSVETATTFVAGPATGGTAADTPVGPIRKLDEWVAAYTDRSSPGSVPSYDWLDTHFRNGGGPVYFSRYSTTDYGSALSSFGEKLGPGQLVVIGNPAGTALYTDMQAHCIANKRVAIRDVDAAMTVTAMEAVGAEAPVNDEYGATFGPWITIPPPAGVSGVGNRDVPASALVAAMCSRIDGQGNPNRAPSVEFSALYGSAPDLDLTNAEMTALVAAGVNPMSVEYGRLRAMGFWTNVPVSTETPFWSLACSRTRMYMMAKGDAIGTNYYMKTVDGRHRLENRLKTDLNAMCKDLWGRDGLYGDTPQDAYNTSVDVNINTVNNLAQGLLTAITEARYSAQARSVTINLVSVPVSGTVSS